MIKKNEEESEKGRGESLKRIVFAPEYDARIAGLSLD